MEERGERHERTHEKTVMRPLSRGAHGWAVALIIDVVGNLCRQETKLPAVPPHYDIISEGWPTAAVYPITRAAPWHAQRRAPVPQWTRSHTLTNKQTHLCKRLKGGKKKNQIHICIQMDILHSQISWPKTQPLQTALWEECPNVP